MREAIPPMPRAAGRGGSVGRLVDEIRCASAAKAAAEARGGQSAHHQSLTVELDGFKISIRDRVGPSRGAQGRAAATMEAQQGAAAVTAVEAVTRVGVDRVEAAEECRMTLRAARDEVVVLLPVNVHVVKTDHERVERVERVEGGLSEEGTPIGGKKVKVTRIDVRCSALTVPLKTTDIIMISNVIGSVLDCTLHTSM